MTVTCAACGQPAALAIKTADAGLRGITSTVYYEPGRAPKGAEPQCTKHGIALLSSLVQVLA